MTRDHTLGSRESIGAADPGRRRTLLTLVRHGETDWNRERRIQGSADIPLNDTGIAQAGAAAAGLADAGYSAVYSSPQSRALATARIIARAMGAADPRTDADLRERSFGEAEGLTDPEITERFPDDDVPGLESRRSVVERALPVLERIAARHPGESVLVVTHGAVISSLVRHLTGGALPRQGETIRNLSLSHFTHEDGALGLGDFNVPSHDAELLRRVADAGSTTSAHQDAVVSSVRA
ncbi:histidine phosphatase family protein [Rathayibacter sp. CAU 1779]